MGKILDIFQVKYDNDKNEDIKSFKGDRLSNQTKMKNI
jgi:hypothetical protein